MDYIFCIRCGTRYSAEFEHCPACNERNPAWKKELSEDQDATRLWKLTQEEMIATQASNKDLEKEWDGKVWDDKAEETEIQWSTKPDDSESLTRPIPVERIRDEVKAPPRRRASVEEAYATSHRRSPKRERTKIFIVGAVVLLAVLITILVLMSRKGSDDMVMPDLVGKTESAAIALLERVGCEADISYEYDDQVAESKVISQDVEKDTELKKGQIVGLVISKGPESNKENVESELVVVPSLTNLTYEEAERVLFAKGLKIMKQDERYDDTIEKDKIIAQSPLKDARVEKGSYVKVTISLGKEIRNYNISVTIGKGGSSSQKGIVAVEENGSLTLNFTPDDGYEISDVKVDGISVGAVPSYTFTNVTSSHTIYVTFRAVSVTPDPEPVPQPDPSPEPDENTDNGGETTATDTTEE